MRVIYATSDLEEWVDVAKNMQKEQNWEPIYWVTTPKNERSIQKAFPFVITQGYIDAVRGRYTAIDRPSSEKVLDEEILEQYCCYEKTALKMMDRMDPTAYTFNVSERTALYYSLLSYWINTIDVLNPDIVLFTESPHALFQYILYAVCIENNIKILRFTPTHIEGLTFLSSSVENVPGYLNETYVEYLNNTSSDTLKIVDTYLKKNRGSYQDALPYYMKSIVNTKSITEKIVLNSGKVNRFIKNKTWIAYKRGAMYSLDDDNITKQNLLSYKLKGYFTKKKLQKSYRSLSTRVDLSQTYIYVALHYQPEKTTSPEGGVFVDQWLMVNMLSVLAPKGWKIYVKEHSSQFAEKLYGEQGRTCDFYKNISSFHNVHLVQEGNLTSFDLIDNAKAVATVTGTVGLEAVIRSKPVLCFGYAWYRLCEGVMDIKQVEELESALCRLEEGYIVDNQKVDAFLYAIEKISFPAYLNPGNKLGVSFNETENINNLTACLIQYAYKI